MPEVETVSLDSPRRSSSAPIAASLRFEAPALTSEDAAREGSYGAQRKRERAAGVGGVARGVLALARNAGPRAGRSTGASLDRAAQLTQKTNQFNLTLVRRTPEEFERLAANPAAICRTLELGIGSRDHGLVGLVVADPRRRRAGPAVIDTLLLSCRVIGRTAEDHLLVARRGQRGPRGSPTAAQGFFVTGPRNGLVADLYPGSALLASGRGPWEYDLDKTDRSRAPYIARRSNDARNRDLTASSWTASRRCSGGRSRDTRRRRPSTVAGWDSLTQIRLVHALETTLRRSTT